MQAEEVLSIQAEEIREFTGAVLDSPDDAGPLDSVFSSGFSSSPRADMYRAWVEPSLYPNERQPVLNNWPAEDLWAYCGIIEGNDVNAVH